MNIKSVGLIAGLVGAVSLAPSVCTFANATVITFEAGTGTFPPGGGVIANGSSFTLDTSGSYVGTFSGTAAYIDSPVPCLPACTSDGTNAFYSFGTLTIKRADSSAFSLTSIDAAAFFTKIHEPLDLKITAGAVWRLGRRFSHVFADGF
jgi:hypothetical protein